MASRRRLKDLLLEKHRQLVVGRHVVTRLTEIIRNQQLGHLENILDWSILEQERVAEASESFLQDTISHADSRIQLALSQADLQISSWDDARWADIDLTEDYPPELLRIGDLKQTGCFERLPKCPALSKLVGHDHIFLFFERHYKEAASSILTSVAWRIAALSSPQTYRFILIDSVDLGRSFSSLLNLPDQLRGQKIWCQGAEIQACLEQLTLEAQDVTQNRLRDKYPTIEAYNLANPTTPIPFRFVFLMAFPDAFSSHSIDILLSLARTGRKSGLYLIMGILNELGQSHQELLDKLLEQGNLLKYEDEGMLAWDDPELGDFLVMPDTAPSKELTDLISLLVKEKLDSVSYVVDYSQFLPSDPTWWSANATNELLAAIGLDSAGNEFNFELGPRPDAFNALIGGRTHSGKTNFLHALILGFCARYSPDELQLYLVDFKEGVEFKVYSDLPHAKAVVLESEREFGLSILKYLDEEMERRAAVFKKHGAKSYEAYRDQCDANLPRVLAILDEFVRLFEEDDGLTDEAFNILLRLVQRGRAFGIHLLLAAQRPVGNTVRLSPVLSQVSVRIAFKCNDADDSALILGDGNTRAALIEEKGVGCITYDPTNRNRTVSVKVGLVSEVNQDRVLRAFSQLAAEKFGNNVPVPVVFDRWSQEDWTSNRKIQMLLSGDNRFEAASASFWLGQSIALEEDIQVELEIYEGQNVLVAGSDEALASNLLVFSALGLALTQKPESTEFILFSDGSLQANRRIAPYWNVIANLLPHNTRVVGRAELIDLLSELKLRIDSRATRIVSTPRIFVFLPGLHRVANTFLQGQEEQADTDYEFGNILNLVLRLGPQVGIHLLMWVDRTDALRGLPGLYDALAYTDFRVALQMSRDASQDLIDTPNAANLDGSRFYFRDQQKASSVISKGRPYIFPDLEAFSRLVNSVVARWE